MVSRNRIILSCTYWAFVLYIFIPLILMVVMGFKDSKFIGFPSNHGHLTGILIFFLIMRLFTLLAIQFLLLFFLL